MKFSKYNYFVPFKRSFILFNGLSHKFMILSKNTAKKTENVFKSTKNFKDLSPIILNKFKNSMFIIEDDFDEHNYIKQKYDESINRKYYTLSILPTYNCNFSCWYCWQKHLKETMSEEIVEKTKKHIELYLRKNEIKLFELAWFGGEPLLQFKKHIVNISRFAINLCNELNIKFFNSITTNGFLMNKTIVDQMKELHFSSFQITIDGDRDSHNKTRHDSNSSSFDIILKNIVYLLQELNYVRVTLRYNYTTENLNINLIVNQLNEIIPPELRNRIDFLPRKVWQIEDEKIDNSIILKILKTISKNGYNIENPDIKSNFTACYVERKHFNTIFHSGAVDKCSNIDPAAAKGYLNNDGEIIWNSENNFNLNNECLPCVFLPLCMGGCSQHKDYYNKNNCFKCDYSEKFFYDMIVNYCEAIFLNQKR